MKCYDGVVKDVSLSWVVQQVRKSSYELMQRHSEAEMQEFVELVVREGKHGDGISVGENVEVHPIFSTLEALHSDAQNSNTSGKEDKGCEVQDAEKKSTKCFVIEGWNDESDFVEQESVPLGWDCSSESCTLLWDAEDFLRLRCPGVHEDPLPVYEDDEGCEGKLSSSEVFHN